MARFCPNCGNPLSENNRFCQSCGTPCDSSAAQAPSVPPFYQPVPPPYQPPPSYQPPPVSAAPPFQPPAFNPPLPYQPPPANPAPSYPPPQYVPGYNSPPPPGAVPGEALIGVIPNASRKKGMFSQESFNIVVTNQRLIFAQLTAQMIKDEAARNRGGGISGAFKAMTAGYSVWQRYLQMPPDQALGETYGNFALFMNQIQGVKFSGDKVLFGKGAVTVGLKLNVGFGGGDDDDKMAKLEFDTSSGRLSFDIMTQFQAQTRDVLRNAGLIR
jgi:hypothetical protein